jgi:hypothetical protein
MAREIEVFRLTPQEGSCYQHVEATRSEHRGGKYRYFSINQPRYVGEFIREERQGGHRETVRDIFKDGDKENYVDSSYEGNTCYIRVDCPEAVPGPGIQGGKRKKTRGGKRNTRRLHKKSKKTRSRR